MKLENAKEEEKKKKAKQAPDETADVCKADVGAGGLGPLPEMSLNQDRSQILRDTARLLAGGALGIEKQKSKTVIVENTSTSLDYWRKNIMSIKTIVDEQVEKSKQLRTLSPPKIGTPSLKSILGPEASGDGFKRLELIGDGIAYYFFCKIIQEKYPMLPLGVGAVVRSKLVTNDQMYHYSIGYDLPGVLKVKGLSSRKRISNIFEAYLGALQEEDKRHMGRTYDWVSKILDNVIVSLVLGVS